MIADLKLLQYDLHRYHNIDNGPTWIIRSAWMLNKRMDRRRDWKRVECMWWKGNDDLLSVFLFLDAKIELMWIDERNAIKCGKPWILYMHLICGMRALVEIVNFWCLCGYRISRITDLRDSVYVAGGQIFFDIMMLAFLRMRSALIQVRSMSCCSFFFSFACILSFPHISMCIASLFTHTQCTVQYIWI